MFKLTIFLWIGLIAWNWHISLAQPVNSNHAVDGALQRNKLGDLFTIIGSILLTPPNSSADGVSLNGTTSSLDERDEPPTRMEKQLMALLTRMEVQQKLIALSMGAHTDFFVPIGSRFFYFDQFGYGVTFHDANDVCRKKGGHLASIESQEELDYMMYYSNMDFWVAFNDQAVEGHYVSSVTNKTAPFLKWKLGEPSDKNHTKNCVALKYGLMYNAYCDEGKHVICEADI